MTQTSSPTTLDAVLVQEKILTPDLLDKAREEQHTTGHSLGRVVVDMGLLEEQEKNELLQKFLGYDLISLKDTEFSPALMAKIPQAFAIKHRVAVLGEMEDRTLIVAMEDPSDRLLIRLLEDRLGVPLKTFLASREDLKAALEHYKGEAAAAVRTDADQVERPAADGKRMLINGLVSLLIFFPLLGFFLELWLDLVGLHGRIMESVNAGTLSIFDLCIYVSLGWVLWALLVYEVSGLLLEKSRHREENE
jgi:hypothetical protein